MPQLVEVHGLPIGLDHLLDRHEHTLDVFDNARRSWRVLPTACDRRPRRLGGSEIELVCVSTREFQPDRQIQDICFKLHLINSLYVKVLNNLTV